jgi:hypothetical protein
LIKEGKNAKSLLEHDCARGRARRRKEKRKNAFKRELLLVTASGFPFILFSPFVL